MLVWAVARCCSEVEGSALRNMKTVYCLGKQMVLLWMVVLAHKRKKYHSNGQSKMVCTLYRGHSHRLPELIRLSSPCVPRLRSLHSSRACNRGKKGKPTIYKSLLSKHPKVNQK
jgi:hypothetical protein